MNPYLFSNAAKIYFKPKVGIRFAKGMVYGAGSALGYNIMQREINYIDNQHAPKPEAPKPNPTPSPGKNK